MKLSDLHSAIKTVVKKEIACAIRLDWVTAIITNQIKSASGKDYQFPTTDTHISAGLEFDTSKFKLSTIPTGIIIEGFTPIIQIKEPTIIAPSTFHRNYNTIRLEYENIEARIEIINNVAKIVIPDLNKIPPPKLTAGQPDLQVITDNGLTQPTYQVREQAIIFQSLYLEIVDQFVDSMVVPNALPAMSLLRLKPPYKYFYNGDYIAITGIPEINFDEHCECRNSSVQRRESRNSTGADITGQTLTYPGPSDIPDVNDPPAFFYIPQTNIELLSNQILKPAITASDEGQFLLFKWYWNLALACNSLNVHINPATFEIIVDSKFEIFGNAGVALKIGCVYQRIVGADLTGIIDPSTLILKFDVDNGNNVMLHCQYNYKIDVDLHVLAGVDAVLNPILDSVLNNLGRGKYEGQMKLFNNKFLDLNNIIARPGFNWRISKSFDSDSFCIGIEEFKKDGDNK